MVFRGTEMMLKQQLKHDEARKLISPSRKKTDDEDFEKNLVKFLMSDH